MKFNLFSFSLSNFGDYGDMGGGWGTRLNDPSKMSPVNWNLEYREGWKEERERTKRKRWVEKREEDKKETAGEGEMGRNWEAKSKFTMLSSVSSTYHAYETKNLGELLSCSKFKTDICKPSTILNR